MSVKSSSFMFSVFKEQLIGNRSAFQGLVLLFLSVLILFLLVLQFRDPAGGQIEYGTKGTRDFVQYWSAYTLFSVGENPYDPSLMVEVQKGLGLNEARPVMMWNPPWLMVMMSPILSLSFPTSVVCWFLLSVCLFFGTALIGRAVSNIEGAAFAPLLISSLLFFPVWESMVWGQISVFLGFGLALLFWGLKRKNDWLSGFGLVVLTVKPHLTFLLSVALVFTIIRERRYSLVLVFALGFFALLTLTHSFNNHAISDWFASFGEVRRSGAATSVYDWRVPTLSGWFRALLFDGSSTPASWPMWLFPLLATIFAVWFLSKIAKEVSDPAARYFIPLLCCSLLFAPYGWIYDYSLLLAPCVFLACGAYDSPKESSGRILVLILIILVQLVGILLKMYGPEGHQWFIWIPAVLLVISAIAERTLPSLRQGRTAI
ncbi:hypothetical protein BVY02_00045 [bacterium J17]|nr:hypothetical protein BVY02_00045 [bacterium J17]